MTLIFAAPELYVWLFGFLFSFVWEISHMPYYQGFYDFLHTDKTVERRYWFGENTFERRKTFARVFWFASVCDGFLILGNYWLISLILWDRFWILNGGSLFGNDSVSISRWGAYGIAVILGIGMQVLVELIAMKKKWWGYAEEMPTIGKHLVLLPNIQMIIPIPLTYLLVRLIVLGMGNAG